MIIALLVGGNLNLNCNGSVQGQTATGTPAGHTYNLSNITPNSTTNGQHMVVDAKKYFEDAKTTLTQVNTDVASKQANATYNNNGYGEFTFNGNPSLKELVYNVNESNFSSFTLNFNLEDNQTAVVNLTSDQAISLLNGSFSINGKRDSNYLRENAGKITFNVVNSGTLNMTSCELYGTLLAPKTDLNGNNASVCGIAIVNNLNAAGGFEFHVGMGTKVPIHTPPITTPPVTTPSGTTTISEYEIPLAAPKTGDESIIEELTSVGFVLMEFGTGLYIDTCEMSLDSKTGLILKRKIRK